MAIHIGDLIPKVKAQLLRESTKKNFVVIDGWEKLVGANIAKRTKVQGFRQKMLYVKVESPVLLNELANFKKDAILQKLQEKYPDQHIRDIKFIV